MYIGLKCAEIYVKETSTIRCRIAIEHEHVRMALQKFTFQRQFYVNF